MRFVKQSSLTELLTAKFREKSAYEIAKLAGVNVPEDTKILIGEVESVDIAEEFAHEKLSPVLAMYKAKTFDEALDKAAQLVADGGYGHTSSLYVHPAEKEKIQKHYVSNENLPCSDQYTGFTGWYRRSLQL